MKVNEIIRRKNLDETASVGATASGGIGGVSAPLGGIRKRTGATSTASPTPTRSKTNEFAGPPPDETSGQIVLRAPLPAMQVATGGDQIKTTLPTMTVVSLTGKLPQKKLVKFAVEGKQYVTTDEAWQKAVQL